MPGWMDKLKSKAEETLHDQEKMDRVRAKAEETLHDPEKMAQIRAKAEGALEHLGSGRWRMIPRASTTWAAAGRRTT